MTKQVFELNLSISKSKPLFIEVSTVFEKISRWFSVKKLKLYNPLGSLFVFN